jgi:ubiquinone/menaquinone biosynthesis C-methylase UbiE
MNDQDIVVEAFTDLAANYEQTVDGELKQFWGMSYRDFVDELVQFAAINAADDVLDLATGTAVIPLSIADQVGSGGSIVGLDITQAMLKYAAESISLSYQGEKITLVCASALGMPFMKDHFDMIICGLGMHHMDASLLLPEMWRVIKPGGKLVLADVGASSFWRSWVGKGLLRILLYGYGISRKSARAQAEVEAFPNVRTKEEWSDLLSSVGFVGINVEEIDPRRPWFPSGLTITAYAGRI